MSRVSNPIVNDSKQQCNSTIFYYRDSVAIVNGKFFASQYKKNICLKRISNLGRFHYCNSIAILEGLPMSNKVRHTKVVKCLQKLN